MSAAGPRCELLSWDSAHFGFPIARLQARTLTETEAGAVDAWCENAGVHCLYFEASPDDHRTAALASERGYQVVDVRLVFERAVSEPGELPGPVVELRPARAEDVPALEEIARTSFGLTRFFFDQRFARERVAEMYAIWVRRSVEGWADAVLVSGPTGEPAGMITCHVESGGGRIGLIGTDARARGRGLGRGLMRGALDWFRQSGSSRVTVATQARNADAQRLYQRCGFVTGKVSVFYHKWYQ